MCIAIPAEVVDARENRAEVDVMGVRTEVNTQLVASLRPGDRVMVHAGFAISRIEDEYYDFLRDTLAGLLDETT